jgi:hypothetical protein
MIELLLLLMIIRIYYIIYITSMINYHFIILYVLYKQLSSPFNNEYVIYISTHYVVELPLYYFSFFSIRTTMLL